MDINEDLNVFSNVPIKSNEEKLELYSDDCPFSLSLRITNFENETEYKKFLRNCEKTIRGSIEYKLWISYIKDVLQIHSCAITHESMGEVSVEVHHHIPSLYTLVTALTNRKIERDEKFSTFDIALEAIELHFANKIGYVVLIKSMHEKLHNGFLTIPVSLVQGDYKYFVKEFSSFLDDMELDTINSRMSIDTSNCSWSKNEYPQDKVGAL